MDRDSIIKSFKGADSYAAFFESFRQPARVTPDRDGQVMSEALFFHVCKMHYAGWHHRVHFGRGLKHDLADVFEDLVAYYLRMALPEEYTLRLETMKDRIRLDILVSKGDRLLGAIEVKTTIGWRRPGETTENPDPYASFTKRITDISRAFQVPPANVIYIFEDHSNVTKEFSAQFWSNGARITERPGTFPHSIIYPLFNEPDPYYWKEWKRIDRKMECPVISDDHILERSARSIVSPLESVVQRIMAFQ